MADNADMVKDVGSGYRFAHEPDGTSYLVRENLVDILERELLGPIHGPNEVLPFSPRSQYLVGLIAPVKLTGGTMATDHDDEVDSERGHLVESRADSNENRGVPATGADETEAEAEGDDPDDRAPKQGLIIPASMGLRFQVPSDLDSFMVNASWGSYETVETDQVTKAGRPIRHFQRTPVEELRTIRLADLPAGETVSVPLRESICLRVDRYNDPSLGRVLIEIALCNDRETPTPVPTAMWMFQTKLHVTAGGASVLLPVHDPLEQDWAESDAEMQRLNLQYRNRLEYAIGRTCSVDWAVEPGARRATAVWTTWLPVAETPRPKRGRSRTPSCPWMGWQRPHPKPCERAWSR